MTRLPVGTRIRIVEEFFGTVPRGIAPLDGRTGVVKRTNNGASYPYEVEFDGPDPRGEGRTSAHVHAVEPL